MTPTNRPPANDDHGAALEDELIEDVAQEEAARALAGPPSPAGLRLAMVARTLARQGMAAARRAAPPRGPATGRLTAVGPPDLAHGSTDAAPALIADEPDTARLRRMSRAELVALVATHPRRALAPERVERLSDDELRAEARALRPRAVPEPS